MTRLWDDGKRARLSAFNAQRGSAALQLIAQARTMAEGRAAADPRFLLSAYVDGVCSFHDHLQHEIRDLSDRVACVGGFLAPGDSLFDDSRSPKPEIVERLRPELAGALYVARSNEELEQITLLEPSPNELADSGIPPPMNMLLYRPSRPPVCAYASEDAVLYADPFRYQLLSRDRSALWRSGSPRPLSRTAVGDPETVAVASDVIVLQDRFNGANFSHFLFDSITRAMLLDDRLGTLRSSVLVLGGVPGDFHDAVCAAIVAVLGLNPASLFFPDRPVIVETTRRCIWFSDQVEAYLHPAQMAHPVSIGLLRRVVEAIPAQPPECLRVYISRADAEQRRVVNEAALTQALHARGFAPVELSRLSMAEQIGLFRDAELIVAPHGMGLTHLAAADRLRGVVELFSPTIGTDAYAFIAKAGCIDHDFVIGGATGSPVADFTVGIDQVMRCLDRMSNGGGRPSWRKPANLLPGSQSLAGFEPAEGGVDAGLAVPELVWGNYALGHRGGQTGAVGRWGTASLIAGLRYTVSCWVWLPAAFAGETVSLRLGECGDARVVAADPARRETWQRIVTSGIAVSSHCDIELVLWSTHLASFASTCWQLERGDTPGAYVATA